MLNTIKIEYLKIYIMIVVLILNQQKKEVIGLKPKNYVQKEKIG